jgi:hypothetical protein
MIALIVATLLLLGLIALAIDLIRWWSGGGRR